MIGKLDRYLELSYDYAHGDELSDEQLAEHESLQKEINHSIKVQELVKELIKSIDNGQKREYTITDVKDDYMKEHLQSLVEESEK